MNSFDYEADLKLSDQLDRELGFRIPEIEAELAQNTALCAQLQAQGQEAWIGKPVRTVFTPYGELERMMVSLALPAGALVVDLGAGYGRLGVVLARAFTHLRFLGIELVRERCEEGVRVYQKLRLPAHIEMRWGDLSEEPLPAGDAYLIYDYGSRSAIARTLDQLQERARSNPVVVVGRGRATRDAIERGHPWLSGVVAPEHCGNYSIYRSHARL